MHKTALFYFTASYPYDEGEQFIVEEISMLAEHYDKVVLFPAANKNDVARDIPKNAEVCDVIHQTMHKHQGSFRRHFLLMVSVYLYELFRSGKFGYVLRSTRLILSYIKQGIGNGSEIVRIINKYEGYKISYYSTWMDINALSLALLKKQGRIHSFTFKMRGFDLFDERRKGNYMPFRSFNFKQCRYALTMSKGGRDYLRAKQLFSEKVYHNYPGIKPNVSNKLSKGVLTLVSCSNMYRIKRNSAIAEALKQIEFPVHWIHFGDGEEMEMVKGIVSELPDHITVDLKGRVANNEIMKFYGEDKVDAFIHVSSTEGFGYVIIEAYCSQIPTILYPAGGVAELCKQPFSVKVNENFSVGAVVEAIRRFKREFYMNEIPKANAYQFYLENFNPETNSNELYEYIEGR